MLLPLQAFGILVTTPGAVPSGLSAVVAAYVMLVVLIIAFFTAVIGRHNLLLPDSKEVRSMKKCGQLDSKEVRSENKFARECYAQFMGVFRSRSTRTPQMYLRSQKFSNNAHDIWYYADISWRQYRQHC